MMVNNHGSNMQRLSGKGGKSNIMFYLKQQIRELNSEDDILNTVILLEDMFCSKSNRQSTYFVVNYTQQLAYMGYISIPIFTTATMELLANPTEDAAMENC